MRGIGVLLLVLCCYGHFRIEHIYGHHLNVATKKILQQLEEVKIFIFILFVV